MVAGLDKPDERAVGGEAGEDGEIVDLFEDEERGATGAEVSAIGGENLDGPLRHLVEHGGHGGAGALLVGHRAEALAAVMPPDPGGDVSSEASASVPDEPVLGVHVVGQA